MIGIKIILILILLVILRAFLVQKSLKLLKRTIAVAMFAGLLLLVIFPDASTWAAHKIGVGRGADLLFYFAHLFFLLVAVALWRRSLALSASVTKLAREIAIRNAERPEGKEQAGG